MNMDVRSSEAPPLITNDQRELSQLHRRCRAPCSHDFNFKDERKRQRPRRGRGGGVKCVSVKVS